MQIMDSAFSVIALAIAFALIGLNVYITSKILNITDLTCDGSVAIGGCLYGALVVTGVNPIIAFILAIFCGALSGMVTSSFKNNLKIDTVLASIMTLTGLQTFISKFYSFGQYGITNQGKTILGSLSSVDNFIIVSVVVTIFGILIYKILNSEYGLAMRVYGGGVIVSESLGIDSRHMLMIGLAIGNGISALAGALIVQITGSFTVTMGSGAFVFGLATLVIGQRLFDMDNLKTAIIGCISVSIMYKIILEMATVSGADSLGLEFDNLLSVIVLIFFRSIVQSADRVTYLENV